MMSRRPMAGLLIPLILVCVGAVLLLNTLGILPWRSWSEIGRYWPVLVIGFGLAILSRNLRLR
ncbi:MAG: DUF5668 domain-containing protein [Candidatus Bipolaricaulia bacterium]